MSLWCQDQCLLPFPCLQLPFVNNLAIANCRIIRPLERYLAPLPRFIHNMDALFHNANHKLIRENLSQSLYYCFRARDPSAIAYQELQLKPALKTILVNRRLHSEAQSPLAKTRFSSFSPMASAQTCTGLLHSFANFSKCEG